MYNFYEQLIIGDSADNVQLLSRSKGRVYAGKYFKDCDNKIPIHKESYTNYLNKNTKVKPRQKYTECYHLLKLRTE